MINVYNICQHFFTSENLVLKMFCIWRIASSTLLFCVSCPLFISSAMLHACSLWHVYMYVCYNDAKVLLIIRVLTQQCLLWKDGHYVNKYRKNVLIILSKLQ